MAGKYIPSMAAIARELGVSVATVSRSLKGGSRHSAETKARVLATASRLGYSPNLLISGIRGAGTRTIGVSLGVGNDFFLALFNGIMQAAWARGYTLVVLSPVWRSATCNEKIVLDALVERRVDGVIAHSVEPALIIPYYERLRARGLPIVLVDSDLADTQIAFSGTDDRRGGWLAAEHLASLGHRVLAHLPGEPFTTTGRLRQQGFADYVAAHPGLTAVLAPRASFAITPEEVAKFLTDQPAVTAVFAASDFGALAACEAARGLGRRVPEDLSVMGFGNLQVGAWATPALTTFEQHPRHIGETAAGLLIDAIDQPAVAAQKRVRMTTPELVVRQSSVSLRV